MGDDQSAKSVQPSTSLATAILDVGQVASFLFIFVMGRHGGSTLLLLMSSNPLSIRTVAWFTAWHAVAMYVMYFISDNKAHKSRWFVLAALLSFATLGIAACTRELEGVYWPSAIPFVAICSWRLAFTFASLAKDRATRPRPIELFALCVPALIYSSVMWFAA